MSLIHSIDALRCRLCRNSLLGEYEVYSRTDGQFGIPQAPVLCGSTVGYFFSKNSRHSAEVLEIAGNIAMNTLHSYRLLAFDGNASAGSLLLIGNVFYRVSFVREITQSCRILELEVESIEASS